MDVYNPALCIHCGWAIGFESIIEDNAGDVYHYDCGMKLHLAEAEESS